MKFKLSQAESILKFLRENKKSFIPIYQIQFFGLTNKTDRYIVDTKRILPKLAEEKLVESRYVEGKNYKEWRITEKGLERIGLANSNVLLNKLEQKKKQTN